MNTGAFNGNFIARFAFGASAVWFGGGGPAFNSAEAAGAEVQARMAL